MILSNSLVLYLDFRDSRRVVHSSDGVVKEMVGVRSTSLIGDFTIHKHILYKYKGLNKEFNNLFQEVI